MGFQLPFPQLVIFAPLLGKLRPAFLVKLAAPSRVEPGKKPSLHFKVYTLGLGPSFKQISYLGVGKLEETFTKKHAPKPSKNLQSQQLPQLPCHHLTGTTGTWNWKESPLPHLPGNQIVYARWSFDFQGFDMPPPNPCVGRWGGWVGGFTAC